MTSEPVIIKQEKPRTKVIHRGGGEAVYGLGMIGAWVFYIGQVHSFWPGVLAFLKGIVWPAFLVFDLLKYLH
jgi:hypothetical protein